ncbi:NADPH-dependent FMN reductase [Candidatus Saccharibacteria bacterium]|nr:MAG: NADPH-dependent FMN reductase [Candidatus Saccharibacteria bacterium]
MVKIKVITGSSRPGRFNIQPARWIADLAEQRDEVEVELVDLAELNLPFMDEPMPPSMANGLYQHEHTIKWAKTIADADGFIFVTPEYNHSYSAILKNAIDYLFFEWHYKPASFVSYGSVAGGARSVEHLRGIAAEIKLYDIREQVLIPNLWGGLNDNGEYQFTDKQAEDANALLDQLVFWAAKMKDARAELQQ